MQCKVKKITFIFITIFYFSSQVYAHKINLFVLPLGNKLEIKAFFGDGSPCKDCLVKILDEKGKVIAQANTNDEGKTVIYSSKFGNLKAVVYAGEGHFAEKEIKLESTKGSEKKLKVDMKREESHKECDNREIIKEVKIMQKKLEEDIIALRKDIEDLRVELQKTKIQDIIGALGYILGFFGLLILLKKRNAS